MKLHKVGDGSVGVAALIFFVLMAVALTGYRLLTVCGFSVPFTTYVVRYCQTFEHSGSLADKSTAHSSVLRLRAQLLALDTRLQLESACGLTVSDVTNEDQAVQEESESPAVPEDDIEDRVREEGGSTGALNIMLQWFTKDDLDLYVDCPSGEQINYRTDDLCGGKLDVDMNRRQATSQANAVENVVFEQGSVPAGEFTVSVRRHGAARGRIPGTKTPFRIVVSRSSENAARSVLLDISAEANRDLFPVGTFTIP